MLNRRYVCRSNDWSCRDLDLWPLTLKTQSVCLYLKWVFVQDKLGFTVLTHSAVHELLSSQDFHGRRCVTFTFDSMTLKMSSTTIKSAW